MQNEEMMTLLIYILYNQKYRQDYSSLFYYIRNTRINCRIKDKKDVTNLLEVASKDYLRKKQFIYCINEFTTYLDHLKALIQKENVELSDSLHSLFNSASGIERKRRYLIDFYVLFSVLFLIPKESLVLLDLNSLIEKIRVIQREIQNPSDKTLAMENKLVAHFNSLFQKISNS
ncbi:MAG: hypothetical protein MK193_04120 [Lentisphaeria bacterium]|nr:hypothetical protein [Lentisphaeria bacterium]